MVELNLIEWVKGKIKVNDLHIHLDEDHPISAQNHCNWRMDSIHNLTRRESKKSDYHLSVAFTADEAGKLRVKELIKEFAVKSQKDIASNPGGKVHYLIFDLY